MASQFSFSFSGDDIEDDVNSSQTPAPQRETPTAPVADAFPIQGKPLLPPVHHDLDHMLSRLPSKIAYSMLDVDLDGRGTIQIPRRELWDVRVQLMAEGENDAGGESESELGLGKHDVRTGIYEGGFKSWESSVDLVKVLASQDVPSMLSLGPCRLIEVGRYIPCYHLPPHIQFPITTIKKHAPGYLSY
jgi:protein-histidine N-methyltransferase